MRSEAVWRRRQAAPRNGRAHHDRLPAKRPEHGPVRDAMTSRRRQLGLSLVELMVSITLGLLILSGVLVVFVNTSAARSEVERTSRQIENGRYAAELLSEDLRLAGFYGELNAGVIPPPGALPAAPCSITPADWSSWIQLHLHGSDDSG